VKIGGGVRVVRAGARGGGGTAAAPGDGLAPMVITTLRLRLEVSGGLITSGCRGGQGGGGG
jgi:hypothetical protein